jgi:hypothetical protein
MSSPDILGEPREQPKREFPWPIVVGAAVVVVVIGLIAFLTYKPAPQPGAKREAPPYAAKLELRDIKMATANNYVGGSVTYLEGSIVNSGDKTVAGVTVEATWPSKRDRRRIIRFRGE